MDRIEKKVRESDQIINNLLFYSRLRLPRLEAVRLNGILDEVTQELVRRSDGGKRFSVVWSGNAARGMVIEADPFQLRELLMNVANNAFDAISSEGRIEIAVGTDGGNVLVRGGGEGGFGVTRGRIRGRA
jgi:signal transduction histidine kinase